MRIQLQPAFVLHHKPYRETSVIADLITRDYGRIAVVARGVRSPRSRIKALFQPFMPLWVSWQGKTELMTLGSVEGGGTPLQLRGECLLSAFYLNELLIRVLPKQDPHPRLYTFYYDTLLKLESGILQQKVLRLFEKNLLDELGYGLHLQHEFLHGTAIQPEKYYYFYLEQGFASCADIHLLKQYERFRQDYIFSGQHLLSFAAEQLESADVLRDAKRLMRFALAPLLGSQPLHSRKLILPVGMPK